MDSRPATTAKASRAGATPPCGCLPEEIVIWEILVRLPPKSLLRCRAVHRAWRRATSTQDFLLAHHDRQPSLPIVWSQLVSDSKYVNAHYKNFLAFDHRATDAQVQHVARIKLSYRPEAFHDGLLILSKCGKDYCTRYFICNPVTREHSPIGTLCNFGIFSIMGMYLHRPTSEYRVLLQRSCYKILTVDSLLAKEEIGYYIFVLGSDQPPRYIQGPDGASKLHFTTPASVRDSLHWFPVQHQSESRPVIVFDTIAESFRQMRAPVIPTKSHMFEMDDTLGIYSYNAETKVVHIWMLKNYEREVWEYKYQVELPVAEIGRRFGRREDGWRVSGWGVRVVSAYGDILLLLNQVGRLFYVNTNGELVDSFHRDGQHLCANGLRLKQTLVPHNFFKTLEENVVNASPFL